MNEQKTANLHPDLQECLRRIETVRTRTRTLVDGLDRKQFNWRPDPKRWSIGECLEHLVLSGEKFVPRIEKAVEEGRAKGITGSGPFKHGFMGNMMVNMSGDATLPPKRRFKAPGFARPAAEKDREKGEIVGRFFTLQDRLEEAVKKADGLDLAAIKAPSPMPVLKFSLGQWLFMTTGHQLRHVWQAEQVQQAQEFPAAA